jgi:hypothetical protein
VVEEARRLRERGRPVEVRGIRRGRKRGACGQRYSDGQRD